MTIAFVLAGGFKPELGMGRPESGEEALIRLGQSYMVKYVTRALSNVAEIRKIIIAGPSSKLAEIYAPSPFLTIVEQGKTAIQSFGHAFAVVPPETQQILVVTSDLPLLTTEAVHHFLQACRPLESDLFYSIVRREVIEEKFPGVQRTYVRLKEGVFTGGNLILLKANVVEKCLPRAEKLVFLRKKPLALVTHLNPLLLFSYLWGRLSIQNVAEEVGQLLGGIRGAAIESPYAEISFDVDKVSDLQYIEKMLYLPKK